jgi:hypothetical protein
VISGYLGRGNRFCEALAAFGAAYADQTERDWVQLCRSNKVPNKAAPKKAQASA